MPELPEVETLCRQLRMKIAGKQITGTTIYDKKLADFGNVNGCRIEEVRRYGKMIILRLDDKRQIAIHLRMTGRLFWRRDDEQEPHTRWRMSIDGGNIDLVDPRRFATVRIEAMAEDKTDRDLLIYFNEKEFLSRQAIRRVSVKALLMDPRAIAGIGNIYACEILNAACVSPLREAATLSLKEWKRIFREGKRILKNGIEKRGTSISDWRDLYGCKGEYQKELKVYGQEGKPCSSCGGRVVRIKQGGRSTFYCPQCQK